MPGPYKISDWNDLIQRVNEILEKPPNDDACQPLEPIEEVTAPHIWAKSDIREVQDALKETCPDITFAEIDDMWKQSTIDEIEDAMLEAWCNCEISCANARIFGAHEDDVVLNRYYGEAIDSLTSTSSGCDPITGCASELQEHYPDLYYHSYLIDDPNLPLWSEPTYPPNVARQTFKDTVVAAVELKLEAFAFGKTRDQYDDTIIPGLQEQLAEAITPEEISAIQDELNQAQTIRNEADSNYNTKLEEANSKAEEAETYADAYQALVQVVADGDPHPKIISLYSICASQINNYWTDTYTLENYKSGELSGPPTACLPKCGVYSEDYFGSYNYALFENYFAPLTGRAIGFTYGLAPVYGSMVYHKPEALCPYPWFPFIYTNPEWNDCCMIPGSCLAPLPIPFVYPNQSGCLSPGYEPTRHGEYWDEYHFVTTYPWKLS